MQSSKNERKSKPWSVGDYAVPLGDADDGEGCAGVGQGIWEISVLPLNSASNLKLLCKKS